MGKPMIIPTPRQAEYSGRLLEFDGFRIEHAGLAAPYALELLSPLLKSPGKSPLTLTALEHSSSQAYEIRISADQITIRGAGPVAFIYAATTLLQLRSIKNSRIIVPEGDIRDFPQFEYRGVNWQLLVECRGWSQDSGEGRQKLIDNCCDSFDLLATFKLNAVFIDGFGWNPERFPGYNELMRSINREARRRGIKLMYGGYNAGYGAQWHPFDGPVFRNQSQYPEGEIYNCIGSQMEASISRTMGTCLSNLELNQQKQQNLREFVKAVEPGMLYIHGLDISTQQASLRSWAQRCPECRRLWPNDDINAADGMAGAFARFYDELYEAIIQVRNPSSNYDAARDCTACMVSPNYTNHNERGEEWQFHLEYFKILTGCLKHKEIQLVLREQFFSDETSLPRFEQLRHTTGNQCKLGAVYFSSGSGYYNSLPVTADAACIRYFTALNTVIAGSGNAFQEARQAILAEYLWNPVGSAWQINLPEQSNLQEFLPLYDKLCDGKTLPEAIFAHGGLLEQVCDRLYGQKAGLLAAQAQRPQTYPCFEPVNKRKPAALAAVFPLHNEIFPGNVFSVFRKTMKVSWHPELNLEALEFAGRYASLLPRLIKVTRESADLFRQASACCLPGFPLKADNRQAHLKRLADTCAESVCLLEFTRQWLLVLDSAWKLLQQQSQDKKPISSRIDSFLEQLKQHAIALQIQSAEVIDPSGADIGQAQRTVDFIQQELLHIRETLESGKFPENKPVNWW